MSETLQSSPESQINERMSGVTAEGEMFVLRENPEIPKHQVERYQLTVSDIAKTGTERLVEVVDVDQEETNERLVIAFDDGEGEVQTLVRGTYGGLFLNETPLHDLPKKQ